MSVISIKKLNKKFKIYETKLDRLLEIMFFIKGRHTDFNALTDINLEVNKGDILGIIGSNGAGKSTLLKIITGVTKPTSGKVKINGKVASLLELGAAFNMDLTGIQNIYQQGQILGMSNEEIEKKVDEIVEFSGIGENVNQLVKTYSSGMFARLAFSSAINMDFDILIVDEILSVGDTNFQNKCINKMKELTERGKTILFVSHDLHAVKYFCNRIIRLDKGKIIEEGTDVLPIVERYEKNILPESMQDNREENKKKAYSTNEYVTINKVTIIDREGKVSRKIRHKENMRIRINYTLHKYEEGIFFGVGIRNSKNEYINGMNTKQEGIEIPQKPGEYVLELEYLCPLIYKDVYTLWGVCYNSTGTVVLSDYIIKDAFEIYVDKETCEGVTYIEHKWQYK